MKPYGMLSVKSTTGVATIIGDGENSISLIGASMSNVTRSGSEEYLDQISVELGAEKVGVIAVSVFHPKSRAKHCFLINVEKDGEKIDVPIKHEYCFIPLPGRMAQIHQDGRIEVIVDESIYTNSFPRVFTGSKTWHLVDADNLCKYIAGTIEKDDLEKASTEHRETQEQKERIAHLEHQVREMENKLSDEEVVSSELQVRVAELSNEKQQLIQKTVDLEEGLKIYKDAANSLNEATSGKRWFVRIGLVHNFFYAIAYGEFSR